MTILLSLRMWGRRSLGRGLHNTALLFRSYPGPLISQPLSAHNLCAQSRLADWSIADVAWWAGAEALAPTDK